MRGTGQFPPLLRWINLTFNCFAQMITKLHLCWSVSGSYLEKFTDFLRLFVSVHLRRIESSPQFPIVEFLALLFKYTFNQVILFIVIVNCYNIYLNIILIFNELLSANFPNRYNVLIFISPPTKATLPVWISGVSFWIF